MPRGVAGIAEDGLQCSSRECPTAKDSRRTYPNQGEGQHSGSKDPVLLRTSAIRDRRPITVNNQRCKVITDSLSASPNERTGRVQYSWRYIAQQRHGWKAREDGGSADSVPDTSSHRCRLLLPSDMNGPPFFWNCWADRTATLDQGIPAGVSLSRSDSRFFHGTHDRREKETAQSRPANQGQVEAIERTLDQEAECSEVLHNISACRGAMDALMAEVIEGHIRFHVLDPKTTRDR